MPAGIHKNLGKRLEQAPMLLGEKLRQLRDSKEWTQPEAADSIGIEQSYLSKLENDRSLPSLEVFRRLIDAYDVSVAEVMEDIDPSSIPQLSQITDVADYVNTQRQLRREMIQKRTRLQTITVAFGAGLIYAGLAELFFPSAATDGTAWMNQSVTFVGIVSLTYGLIGLLVASAKQTRKS